MPVRPTVLRGGPGRLAAAAKSGPAAASPAPEGKPLRLEPCLTLIDCFSSVISVEEILFNFRLAEQGKEGHFGPELDECLLACCPAEGVKKAGVAIYNNFSNIGKRETDRQTE